MVVAKDAVRGTLGEGKSPTVGGSNRRNQGLPCSASMSWWGHWVTFSLIQCTRGGLLPAVERAPWEGQVRLQRNRMGGTPPNELLSHLALSPFSPSSNWSLLDHESGERVSPDVLESRVVLAFPTTRELRPQMLKAQCTTSQEELQCAHLPGPSMFGGHL